MVEEETRDYTPEELAQIRAQTQLMQTQAQQDSGLFTMQEADMESSRQFYLGYEEELDNLVEMWRGKKKTEKGWVKDDNSDPMMGERAISTIRTMLNTFLLRAVRLGNYEPRIVNLYAYQARKHVSKWLHTSGWLKYGIPLEHLNGISFQCGQLVHASLTWAQNGGGRHFMTTTNRTIENYSLVAGPQGTNVGPSNTGGGGGGQSKKFFKLPKMPTPW